jgi:hypothetical protein
MFPIFHRNACDLTIQKSFKINGSQSQEHIFGRFPFKGLKIVPDNELPEDEHLSTAWNSIVEPQGDILPLLFNPSHPEKMVEHLAIPSIDFPGYWSLSGKSGLFFENICCANTNMARNVYFYGLTDDEVKVLRYRTNLNKKFILRETIFDYMMSRGAFIAPIDSNDPPDEETATSDDDDDDDVKPPAKKAKTSGYSHPGQEWLHRYTSENEDSDTINALFKFA